MAEAAETKQGQTSPKGYVWSANSEDRVGPQASWGPGVPTPGCLRQREEEALAGQGAQDSNVAEGSLLLSLVVDEELCIVDCFGQQEQAARSRWYGCDQSHAHQAEYWQRCATEAPRGAGWPRDWPHPRLVAGCG